MAALRPPGVGPIVGHTSDKTCRIWIRAADPADDKAILDENRRTFGVIGMVSANGKIGRAWYFRLQREYDRTGVFLVGKDVQLGYYETDFVEQDKPKETPVPKAAQAEELKPDQQYTIRVGTLTLDDPLPNEETLPDWQAIKLLPNIESIKNDLLKLPENSSVAIFRTFPTAADSFSFLLGSCRYPGLLWKIKDADRIFGPMREHFVDGSPFGAPPRLTMMCGDQIYADTLNKNIPILLADKYEEFQERYLSAFGAPNLRALMRNATTYMILDDHEIEDNWTQDRLHDTGKHYLFNNAISAYMSYQWSHGPRTFGRRLYYNFECGGYPFFVLDTRTQRFKDGDGLEDNHLLGRPSIDPAHKGQLQELLDWLSEKQAVSGNIPKFIVTSSVFVPNAMDERLDPASDDTEADLYKSANAARRNRSDSWPAFPNTRRALLEHIVGQEIQNVVFLSGDIHSANTAEIDFLDSDAASAKAIKAFSVTSSAFYWPFPFADGDPNGYVHDSRQAGQRDSFPLPGANAVMQYKAYGFTQEDNFTRLDVDRKTNSIVVRVFDRKGKLVDVSGPTGSAALSQSNTLRLVPW